MIVEEERHRIGLLFQRNGANTRRHQVLFAIDSQLSTETRVFDIIGVQLAVDVLPLTLRNFIPCTQKHPLCLLILVQGDIDRFSYMNGVHTTSHTLAKDAKRMLGAVFILERLVPISLVFTNTECILRQAKSMEAMDDSRDNPWEIYGRRRVLNNKPVGGPWVTHEPSR